MKLYAVLTKVQAADDGTILVYGTASTEAVDADGEIVLADAIRAAIPDYLRLGPALREMHQLSAAGTTMEIEVGDDGVTHIVARVVDPIAVKKVRAGVYRGFSIGGSATARDPANRKRITGLRLTEISLVDRPANPEAVFDCWKAAAAGGRATDAATLTRLEAMTGEERALLIVKAELRHPYRGDAGVLRLLTRRGAL